MELKSSYIYVSVCVYICIYIVYLLIIFIFGWAGLHSCAGFFLVVVSGGCALVVVAEFLIVGECLVAEPGLYLGCVGSVVAAPSSKAHAHPVV